jgi:catechol 2,3-dioxygenase-like lactoylglutathione lyase family enzyme
VDEVKRFYRDALGLEQISSAQQDPTGERLVWFAVGDRQLHLVVGDTLDPPTTRHMALLVEDFDGFIRHLEAFGARLRECSPGQNWGRRPNGRKYAICFDPVGHQIELMENIG